MSFFAQRLSHIKPSPTLGMMARANALKKDGKDIIILAAGEPDFNTPDWIQQGAIQAMDQGLTKYTPVGGILNLKQAIQNKFIRDNNLHFDTDEIMVSTGAKQVIFNAMMATLDPGDEVVIPAPYWASYPDVVSLFGATPVIVDCREDTIFKLTPESLKNAITDKTKWLILNSPSNPTGAVYSKSELEDLGRVLNDHPNVHVLCDDIYEHLIYDFCKFSTLLQAAPFLKNRTLVVNGVSKSYAMTGWRIGYGAGPKDLIKAMTTLQSQSTSNPCSIAQGASVIALNASQSFLNEWREIFERRRDLVLNHIENIDGLSCINPQGAFYVYVNCSEIIGKVTPKGQILKTDGDFCEYLLDYANVAAVAGSAFGLSPFFRASYALSDEDLNKAMKRIQKAVQNLS